MTTAPTNRVRIKADTEPTDIMTYDSRCLGTFLPGLGYWLTTENYYTLERLIYEGKAEFVDPATAPFASFAVEAAPAQVSGSITVKD